MTLIEKVEPGPTLIPVPEIDPSVGNGPPIHPIEGATLIQNLAHSINDIHRAQCESQNCEMFIIAQNHNHTHILEQVTWSQMVTDHNLYALQESHETYCTSNNDSWANYSNDICNHFNGVHDRLNKIQNTHAATILNLQEDLTAGNRQGTALEDLVQTLLKKVESLTRKVDDLSAHINSIPPTNNDDMDFDVPDAQFTRASQSSSSSSFPSPATLSNIIQSSVNSAVQSTVNTAVSSALLPVWENLSSISRNILGLKNSCTVSIPATVSLPAQRAVSPTPARQTQQTQSAPSSSQDFLATFDDIQPPHPHANPDFFCQWVANIAPPPCSMSGPNSFPAHDGVL